MSLIAYQNYKLNLQPGGVPVVLHTSQYDHGWWCEFTLYNGGTLYTIPEGVSGTIRCLRPDGTAYAEEATVGVGGSVVGVSIGRQINILPGMVACELVLADTDGNRLGTANFCIKVESAPIDEDAEITEEDLAYAEQVLTQLQSVAAYNTRLTAAESDIDDLETDLAAEVTRATAAETTLQSNINSEASTRASADESLREAIDAMVSPSGQSVVVDTSLSISGAAADAAVTGSELTDLKSAIDWLNDSLYAEHTIKGIPCIKVYANHTISTDFQIDYQGSGIAVYLFDVSQANEVVVGSGSVYGWFATVPVINDTVTVDSTRHVGTLNNTKLTVLSGASYLAVVSQSGEPSVTYDISTTQELVEKCADDVSGVQEQCGDVYYESNPLTPTQTITGVGIRNTAIGSTLNEFSTTSYPTKLFSVTAGKYYEISTVQGTSTNYPYYAYFTDDAKVCKAKYLATGTTSEIVTAPTGATRLYVMGFQRSDGTFATEKTLVPIQDQINALREDGADSTSIKKGKELLDSIRPVVIGYNAEHKFINFSWCTDVHTNGVYAYNDYVSMNNIRLFSLLNAEKWLDFAAFGGDLYSSYGLTREEALAEIDNSMQIMRPSPIPFYMVKGNHELNTKTLHIADPNDLDWDNVTYYIIDPTDIKEYVAITENEWDGVQRLYYGSADPESFITRTQWSMIFQNHVDGVFNASDPYGGYFYKDFDTEKIRVIVLNCYDTDREGYSFLGAQVKFIAENALNFSDKAVPSDWGVLIFVHNFYSVSEVASDLSGNTPAMYNALTAFAAGTDYTATVGGVSVNAEFSAQGAGKIIAVIHGHRHADTYDNSFGWNNIGTIAGFSNQSNVGSYDEFGFDVFTVDTVDKVIYETRFGRGTSRSFSFGSSPNIIT